MSNDVPGLHPSMDAALTMVVRQACATLDIGRCVVLMPDDSQEMLRCVAIADSVTGYDPDRVAAWRLPRRQVAALRTVLLGRDAPLVLTDVGNMPVLPREELVRLGVRSLLIAPLRCGTDLVGVLVLDEPGVCRDFSPRDVALVHSLAAFAGMTIANTGAFAQERRLRKVDEGLRALVLEISSIHSPGRILEVVVGHIREVFEADAVSAWLADGEGNTRLLAAEGFSDIYLDVARRFNRLSPGYRALHTGQSVYIVDRSVQDDPVGRAADLEGIRSMLFLPMIAAEQPMGVIILAHRAIHRYTEALLAQAEGFARQAALAIHNAGLLEAKETLAQENERLYEAEASRARQLSALLHLSERLHSMSDLDALLQEVTDAVIASLGFRIAVLNIRDGPPGRFIVRSLSGAREEERQQLLDCATEDWPLLLRPEFRRGRCYLLPPEYMRSLTNLEGFVFPDLPPAGPGEWDAYHALFVPIGGDGIEAAAILSVDEPIDRRLPSPATFAALEAFAAQAALALDKARLYAEAQQRAGELEGIITSMADGVILGTPDGAMRSLNAAATRLFSPGGPLANGAYRRLRDAMGATLQDDQLPLARALRGEEVPPLDLLAARDRNDEVWLSFSGAPIRDTTGVVVASVAVVREVTAERDLERLRRSFVATVSHELRTPLSAVIGYSELLRERWLALTDDRKLTMLDNVVASASRLERLVYDLLLLSQVEAGELQVQPAAVDLALIVQQAATEAYARYPDQEIQLCSPVTPATAWADRHRVQQIVSNLVDNAAKYGGEAGPISVAWDTMDAQTTVWVIDHGPGIAPANRGRLFTRFGKLDHRQMRRGFVGTGLGLFISHQLAEAMGGTVWHEETPGGGSTFALRLPAISADQPQAAGTPTAGTSLGVDC